MTICRLLTQGDEARLEAFLATRPEESLLMVSNLKRVGFHGGSAAYEGRYALGDCIAEKAIRDSAAGTNPRPLTVPEIEQVVRSALTYGRPTPGT